MRKMNEKSKENAKQGKEPDSENKTDPNVEQDAFDLVELVFTGKYYTYQQYDNLVKLTEELKNNDIASVYIYNGIKELINSTEKKDNENLKKTLEKCYRSLNNKFIIHDDLPRYFSMLKNIDINFFYKIVFIFKVIYENKIIKQKFDDINKRLNKNEKNLYSDEKEFNNFKGDIQKKTKEIYIQIQEEKDYFEKAKKDIFKKINETIYPQFITILGIFTAITFAIFGGMNLLSNLFQNIKSTHASLGQALILVAVFNLCLWGIIELLFNWISKITNAKNKNINKYKLTALFILLCLFIFGLALFFKLPLFFF